MNDSIARIWTVFKKEVIDNLRDRRSVFSALASGLIGPVLLVLMIVIMGRTIFADLTERPLQVPISGAEYAPNLVLFLQQNGVVVVPAPANLEALVRSGDLDLGVVISSDYGEDFSSGRPATVQMVIDSSRNSSIPSIERTRILLDAYSSQVAALRLMARGINPSSTMPVAIERIDVSTPQSQVLMFLNMLPYFIIMVIFLGGMYVIIDATAGERERGSLEPLLINPVKRWEFVIAKLMASLPFALMLVIFTLLAFALAFNVLPLEELIGFTMRIDLGALFGIFLISLPMIFLASALQMIIATYTRSFKEAQTYVGFLPLIPALPGLALAFINVRPTLNAMLIPTYGQQILINQMMRGEVVSPTNLLVSTLATLVFSAFLIFLAIRLFKQDRIIFGTR